MIIGIAGKIGAGKSYIAGILQKQGWLFLDLDKVAHWALENLAEEITREFGKEIIVERKLSSSRLARKVFGVPGALERLEKITYPWIEQRTKEWLGEWEGKDRIIEAVNLHKTSLPEDMDLIIWVKVPIFMRFFRIMKRDGYSLRDTIRRFRSQASLGPKLFHERTETYIVGNTNNKKKLFQSLSSIPGINLKSG